MSDDKKQKGNWRLVLIGVVLSSVITVGAFWITPSDLDRAKNLVVNRVKNLKWDFGIGETKVITTSIEKDRQGKILKTTTSKETHPGKTLWDLLELAGTLAVPILIAVLGHQFQQRDKKKAEEQAKLEREIVNDNLSEEAIQVYLDSMGKLLLNKELRKELFPNDELNFLDKDNSVRDVARIRTITILRRLEGDQERQARILDFLRDAELYKFIFKNANLSRINLSVSFLVQANLSGAKMAAANLCGSTMFDINLSGTSLVQANLSGAYLWGANLSQTCLDLANLSVASLLGANLLGTSLLQANLIEAKLIDLQNLTPKQIKSACFWDQAIYKGRWVAEELTWAAIEPNNTNYIEDLKKDKSSDPEEPVDCSIWEK